MKKVVECELINFNFDRDAREAADIIDCFEPSNGVDPWVFLDGQLAELQIEDMNYLIDENCINEFVEFEAIPMLFNFGFEPDDAITACAAIVHCKEHGHVLVGY